ncbi:MAG TPA: serine/threonine-protein kinase, partial [Acidimicrobiales bacterium]|nr:serine/threonine-protein kinase [Acidimicrobiales bacterium]
MKRRRSPGGETPPFAGFRYVREIGTGPFSSVYEAVDATTGRSVALKRLHVGPGQPQVTESLDREVRALAAVSGHPHVVTFYGLVTDAAGRPVLVLERCRGSYGQRVRRHGPLAASDAVAVAVKVAGALETAHRAGIVHRDVKPQNVLETQFGEPALSDFGVAVVQAAAQVAEGVLGFSTLHAAPELLEGGAATPASDVYGLASTLYTLVTGRAPFAAFDGEAPASVILRILRDPVPPLLSPDIPLALSDLLTAALDKDPGRRPPTAAALAEALRAVESGAGWAATPYVVWGEGPAPRPGRAPGPPPTPPEPEEPVADATAVVSAPRYAPPAPPPERVSPAAAAVVAPSLSPAEPCVPRGESTPGEHRPLRSVVAPPAAPRQVLNPTVVVSRPGQGPTPSPPPVPVAAAPPIPPPQQASPPPVPKRPPLPPPPPTGLIPPP